MYVTKQCVLGFVGTREACIVAHLVGAKSETDLDSISWEKE